MPIRSLAIATLAILGLVPAALGQEANPYASDRSDAVKTLTPDEVDGLLAGDGMGQAKPAEMNGFPGPKHVLDLADSLDLEADQRARVGAIRDAMREKAVALGEKVVEGERALDAAFAGGAPAGPAVRDILEGLAADRAALRYAHLEAHLATTEILSRHQIHEYARLRGYAADGSSTEHDHDPSNH